DRGKEVILAGLDQDFRREPFGPMGALLAIADEVVKLRAICMRCGRLASHTQRIIDGKPASWNDPIVLIGATESYEARCRACHEVPHRPAARRKAARTTRRPTRHQSPMAQLVIEVAAAPKKG